MRRFLRNWLLGLIGVAMAVFALTVGIDPYGVIGTPIINGFNADKVAAADRPRFTKPVMVERRNWRTLVLGASNADVGIDPISAAWPAADRPVFNYGIDGSDPLTQLRFLQHAFVSIHPALVLVGLSLEDTMVMPARPGRVSPAEAAANAAAYGYDSRLRIQADGTPNPGYALQRLQDTVFATFSLQALTDSVLTLLRQNDPERTRETAEGQNSAGNFARWLRTEGSYSLVMNKDIERTPKLLAWAAEGRTTIAPLAAIIRLAHTNGARIIVFIMPSYVDQLEVLRQTGLTPLFDQWKMDVARTIETADPAAPPTPLWDFTGISRYTTELLPGPNDTSRPLQYFWEPVHFRAALGDLMIRRMLDNGGPPDWGVTVTTATLPARAAAEVEKQRQWAETHPADVARLAAVIDAASRAVCGGPVTQCPKPGPRTTASR